jgi:hypothetical protein
MATRSSNKKKPREKETKEKSIERAFFRIFKVTKRKLNLKSDRGSALADRMLNTLVQAATSKCIDFNILCNRTDNRLGPAFVLLASLRGLCEDLIWLTFMTKLEGTQANRLIALLLAQNTVKGLATQQSFFEVNNPMQPVLSGAKPTQEAEQKVVAARDKLRKFWKSMGSTKRDGPTVRDMAIQVGLVSTYDYIYFSSSNFVHFNPQALLRMGWGPSEGPFTFSIHNMDAYYRNFAAFYGAVVFIGFHSAFGEQYFRAKIDSEIYELLALIDHVHRWPEIVTFEEMNQKPPLYFLTHAFGKVMREDDPNMPYGAILQEVQSLRPVRSARST